MTGSQDARTKLFRSQAFRRELATDLGLTGLAQQVAARVDHLLEAGRLPSVAENNWSALAMDGALMISAVGSLLEPLESVIPLTDRFCAMKFQIEVSGEATTGRPLADSRQMFPSISFAVDVAELFKKLWIAPRGTTVPSFCPAVQLIKGDAQGETVLGLIQHLSAKRKRIYSNVVLPIPAEDPFDRLPLSSAGGTILMPAALANLALTLEDGVADGAAAIALNR
jgi:hypothetical protein